MDMRKALAHAALAAGLGSLLALSGCTTMVSAGPGPRRRPPGRARGWGAPGPRLGLIAGTGIRDVADLDEDIFVLGGVWYRHAGGVWFRCRTYGGTWMRLAAPPAAFHKIPPGHAKHRVIKAHKAHKAYKGPKHKGPAHKGPKHKGPAHKGPKQKDPKQKDPKPRGRGRWK